MEDCNKFFASVADALPDLGGWEGPLLILGGLGFVLLLISMTKRIVYGLFLNIAQLEYIDIRHRDIGIRRDEDQENDRAGNNKNWKRPAYILMGLSIFLVLITSYIIFFVANISFIRLSEFSNLGLVRDVTMECRELKLFSVDMMLRGLLIDFMESFGLALSRLTYDQSFNPFSVSVFLTRSAPALIILAAVRELLAAHSNAQAQVFRSELSRRV